MKNVLITFFTVLFCLTSSVGWSLTKDDLVRRGGIFYKKFSNVPFTGTIDGKIQGSFKNGKRDGSWITYWDNGQLMYKGNWKNGLEEGSWVHYHPNGLLWKKGKYKYGKKEGSWVGYFDDGTLYEEGTGTFKDGDKIGD